MTLDELLLEWSYRSERGYPTLDNPSDILLLEKILKELDDGSTIVVANKEEALSTLRSGNIPRSGVPLEGTNGVKTTTSKLKKNVEFGTSKTAAGTTDAKAPVVDTDTKEALVIVMCNVLKEGGNLVPFDKEPYANNFKIIKCADIKEEVSKKC